MPASPSRLTFLGFGSRWVGAFLILSLVFASGFPSPSASQHSSPGEVGALRERLVQTGLFQGPFELRMREDREIQILLQRSREAGADLSDDLRLLAARSGLEILNWDPSYFLVLVRQPTPACRPSVRLLPAESGRASRPG